jgi:hypothetical protein
MFDFRQTRALKQELLAMTPGTSQFAQRLRAIAFNLDAEQARLGGAVDDANRGLSSNRDEDALDPPRGRAPRSRE